MIQWTALVLLLGAPVAPQAVEATAFRDGKLVLRTASGEQRLADGTYRCGQCTAKGGSLIEVRIENGTYGAVLGTTVKPGGVTVVDGRVVIRAGKATLTVPDGEFSDPSGGGFVVRGGQIVALQAAVTPKGADQPRSR